MLLFSLNLAAILYISRIASELRIVFEAELKKRRALSSVYSFIGHHPNEKQLHILSFG